ncbi:hypothetical protein O181_016715 [Austropuccinia psidii MF-1]|uniref:Uncharacterized protein n=1 Tax=Austropuccinia psidii MF-1 TaxID=1389203 RepID=A0A9Q3C6E9_9BASI|nr:hypothetical protein [Austropuccinia psidii MF-1]
MFFTWYPKIILIIDIFRKQRFKLKIPKDYYGKYYSQCQPFNPIAPPSNSTPPLYPAVCSLSSKQKLIQLPSGSDLPMIKTPLLPHQKTGLAFLLDQEIPNGNSTHNLWATSPPGSTFNSRNIITKNFISASESLFPNTPLGGLLADDMVLGKTI